MGFMNLDVGGIQQQIAIQGDEPTDDELRAILEAHQSGVFGEDEGTDLDEPIQPQESEDLPAENLVAPEGPIGIVPTDVRESVRETVEEQKGLMQFAIEAGPSIASTLLGAAAGAPLGPLGVVGGGMIGGLGGEVAAQEIGLAPSSDAALALSAAGPLLGPSIAGGFKLLGRGGGFVLSKAPFVKSARAINKMASSVEEMESFGTQILLKQKGLLSKPAGDLYEAVRKSGVIVPKKVVDKSIQVIDEMIDKFSLVKGFREVNQAIKVLKDAKNALLKEDVSLDTFVLVRSLVGRAGARATSKGGVPEDAAKHSFEVISSGLDDIAKMKNLTGRQARIAKAAIRRSKLEFSIKDMEGGIAKYMKPVDAESVEFNIKGFQKWLMDITNPKHKNFNKNFVDALKDDLPHIKERAGEIAKVLKSSSPGGPGSLVVRGQSAGIGALIGGWLGGGTGAAIGAVGGASGPEMLVSILTSKAGSKALEYALNIGKGELNLKTWMIIGQIATQSLSPAKETKVPETLSGAAFHMPQSL